MILQLRQMTLITLLQAREYQELVMYLAYQGLQYFQALANKTNISLLKQVQVYAKLQAQYCIIFFDLMPNQTYYQTHFFKETHNNYTRDQVIGLINEGLTAYFNPIRAYLSNTFGSHKQKVYMGLYLSSSKSQLTAVTRNTNFTKLSFSKN